MPLFEAAITPASNLQRGEVITADFVVVGSGPGGATCARALAQAGAKVAIIEEGDYFRTDDLEESGLNAMAALYRKMGTEVTVGNPAMPFLQGVALGGTSVINGAICWSLPQDIYQEWTRTDPGIEDYFDYSQIAEKTEETERELNIQPTVQKITGANNLLLAKGAQALGLEHRPIARNVKDCEGLGRCLQGCPKGHKLSMAQSYLPDAAKAGAKFYTGLRALRLIHDGGRVRGVACKTVGSKVPVKAYGHRGVVVACGAIHSPLLLMRSQIKSWALGRFFQAHPGASVGARFPEPVRMWTGATQGHEVIGLRGEGLKFEALGFDKFVLAMRMKGIGQELTRNVYDMPYWSDWGVAVRAQAVGRVRSVLGHTMVHYSLTPADMQKVRKGISVLGKMALAAGADYVTPGVHGFDAKVDDPKRFEVLERDETRVPKDFTLAATHLFGTCRLGTNKKLSVVRPSFEHHDISRLFVVDASVFPSNTGVNPQLSIIALAKLAAKQIIASE